MESLGRVHWCRDVDFGNLPQWIALLVGGIVAVYTVMGIRTARKAYSDDVRTREFAQARLIYAEIRSTTAINGNRSTTHMISVEDRQVEIVVLAMSKDGGRVLEEMSPQTQNGYIAVTSRQGHPLHAVVLRVNNNSDELISKVRVSLNTPQGDERFSGSVRKDRIVGPRSFVEKLVLTEPADKAAHVALVTFRDSSGLWWRRYGSDPVEKTTEPTGQIARLGS